MRNAKHIFCNLDLKNKEHYEQTKLIINSNGSIKIEGDFEIIDCDGIVYGLEGRTALGLCRCGLSLTKPVMVHTAVVLNMNLRHRFATNENEIELFSSLKKAAFLVNAVF
jgi:hypothetical protein